ncbi:MAG: hypothetical protein QUU85_11310 [Candidatus Eisenbacteria bacterium]|nr:hypothetical protein [Candidatus Eisenbacteria bacterium]
MTSSHGARMALSLLVLIVGCSHATRRGPLPPQHRIDGAFAGTIALTGADIREGPVRIEFHEGRYQVQGSKDLAPPSQGAYTLDRRLLLEDQGVHTAEFDWTLILKGWFDYAFDGRELILEQHDVAHGRHRRIVLRPIPE